MTHPSAQTIVLHRKGNRLAHIGSGRRHRSSRNMVQIQDSIGSVISILRRKITQKIKQYKGRKAQRNKCALIITLDCQRVDNHSERTSDPIINRLSGLVWPLGNHSSRSNPGISGLQRFAPLPRIRHFVMIKVAMAAWRASAVAGAMLKFSSITVIIWRALQDLPEWLPSPICYTVHWTTQGLRSHSSGEEFPHSCENF